MRRRNFWRATAGARSRKCFSTWRAAPASSTRRRNDLAQRKRIRVFTAPRRGDDAALLVSAALVVAAACRPRLLADGADDHLGLPAILHHAERRLLCPRRRHVHRRRAAMGHSVPRPAWLL